MNFSIIFGCLLAVYFAESRRGPDRQTTVSISRAENLMTEAKYKNLTNYVAGQHIHYDLYTPNNVDKPQVLRTGDVDALHNSNFNPDWPLRVFIPDRSGSVWTGRNTSCASKLIKDAYLSRDKFNVILIDRNDTALNANFRWTDTLFLNLGNDIARFLEFLREETKLKMDKVYVIAHSSGCHIAGIVGKFFRSAKLGAIVALDPSDVKTSDLPANYYLDFEDALYVEVIYTDTSSLAEDRIIFGHSLFFPNWGQGQPHCVEELQSGICFKCDYFAAVTYFAESIRYPNLYAAVKCPTIPSVFENFDCRCKSTCDLCLPDVYMGGEPLQSKSGLFYLSTAPTQPYGLSYVVIRKKE